LKHLYNEKVNCVNFGLQIRNILKIFLFNSFFLNKFIKKYWEEKYCIFIAVISEDNLKNELKLIA